MSTNLDRSLFKFDRKLKIRQLGIKTMISIYVLLKNTIERHSVFSLEQS